VVPPFLVGVDSQNDRQGLGVRYGKLKIRTLVKRNIIKSQGKVILWSDLQLA